MQGGPSGCEWQVGDDVHEAEIFRPLGVDLWVRYRPGPHVDGFIDLG
jgi:hypothetical protein